MTVSSLSAANAYQNQLKMMQGSSDESGDTGSASGSGGAFMNMVKNALGEASDAQFKSENLQMQSLTGGKVDLSNLVSAVADAELSLHTVVAVRDRVINAYQDIIKMAI